MARFVKPGERQNPLTMIWETFLSLDKFTKFFVIFSILVVASTAYIVNNRLSLNQGASLGLIDFKSYFPNMDIFSKYYLEGKNTINPNSPARAVLWFEPQDQWTYKMYNSSPSDSIARCHYDVLSWWDDGFLRYTKTHDECPGHSPTDIIYDPPIIFLPRMWNGSDLWSLTSSSSATYLVNGSVACQGMINYTGKILGTDSLGIHWNTTQTTNWISGNVPGNCATGAVTHWKEDYWLTNGMSFENTVARGLKRSMGGNSDITSDNWDVTFDKWQLLPWITPTIAPTNTPTPTLTIRTSATPTPAVIKDLIAPKISITIPLNGAMVMAGSKIAISASASDNVGIKKVMFYVNGSLVCSISSNPYSCNWIVRPGRGASYTISATAYDLSNNTASASIVVRAR